MKEKKFFEMAKYIDEDLISEAAEYTPSHNTNDDKEGTVYMTAERTNKGKKRTWQFSAAAVAVLVIAGAVLFMNAFKNDVNYELPTETADTAITGAVTSVTNSTAPVTDITTEVTVGSIDEDSDFYALKLLGLFINENETEIRSRYCIDTSEWEELDDFDLFREIFFGWWGRGTMSYGDMGEMFIDDSTVCHGSVFRGLRFVGFYRISENIYGFELTDMAGFSLLWVDRSDPDTIYREVFMTNVDTNYSFPARNDMTNYQTPYAVRINNEQFSADDGFMSVFKLHELAQKYDISYDRLVKLQMSNSDNSVVVTHDDLYNFQEMYLISESDDKIVLETVLSDFWIKSEMMIPVVCTFEKKDGRWVKNVEVKDLELEYHGD